MSQCYDSYDDLEEQYATQAARIAELEEAHTKLTLWALQALKTEPPA